MKDPGKFLTLAVLTLSAGTLGVAGVAGWKVTRVSGAGSSHASPGERPTATPHTTATAETSSAPQPSSVAPAESSQLPGSASGRDERGQGSTPTTAHAAANATPITAALFPSPAAKRAAEWVIPYVEELPPAGPPPPEPAAAPKPYRRLARRAAEKIQVPRSVGAWGT